MTTAILPPSAREPLASGVLADVVTLDRDDSPQVSCTWISVDGDTLLIASLPENQKVKNLRRDRRVALSCEAATKNAMGLTEYLVVHGRAAVDEGGAAALLQEQAALYMGPGVTFPPMDNPPPGYVIRITVERIGGVGPWVERSVSN
jgi:PPOX class probable F420-dependent enzyme